MLRFVWVPLLFLLSSEALPATGAFPVPPQKPLGPEYHGGGRIGGDTLEDAVVISALPYYDSGSTCGYANDYDEICPYPGSTAPDVVYLYVPPVDQSIRVDLCSSSYDTKVYVWDGVVGAEIGCDDDGCGYEWQSVIYQVDVRAGQTYYIVVDGYGGSCGFYALYVGEVTSPCAVPCPEGAQIEGEPPCEDGYVDEYNPGCDGSVPYPQGWIRIVPQSDGCGSICGRACCFVDQGVASEDFDWYRVSAAGGLLTVTGQAEFTAICALVYGTDCANLQYTYDVAPPCEQFSLQRSVQAGEEIWLWIRPSPWLWTPERDYVFEVCGITAGSGDPGACCLSDGSCVSTTAEECGQLGGNWLGPGTECDPSPCVPVPSRETSWGRIKAGFR